MKQEKLSKWLKLMIIGVSICIAIVYAYITPSFGQNLIYSMFPEFSNWFMPWMIFILITAIPMIPALVYCWKIATEIGKDNSFSYVNAKLLKKISVLAVIDAVYFLAGNILLWLLNMNHPGIIVMSLMLVFAGIAIAVASSALSHLVFKAAEIREENELTI